MRTHKRKFTFETDTESDERMTSHSRLIHTASSHTRLLRRRLSLFMVGAGYGLKRFGGILKILGSGYTKS
jgi:hypothetical protein